MKKNLHPTNYRDVVFFDIQANTQFLTRSTLETSETIEWEDGKTYPLAKVEISSASHPYYTGKKIFVDTAGRVDKFKKRYAKTMGKNKPTTEKEAPTKKTPVEAKAPQTPSKQSSTKAKPISNNKKSQNEEKNNA